MRHSFPMQHGMVKNEANVHVIMNSRPEKDFREKQEGDANNYSKLSTIPSSSRQWSSTLKNPRIVRVSRNFGGKDRHSKVCTVRGLRDRRIRLSVPTAIQLYDLQDRLGLSQPSKVVDWLLDATKHEIDKLPPLLMPAGLNFNQFPQESSANRHGHHQSSGLSHFLNANQAYAKDSGINPSYLSHKEELGIKNISNHVGRETLVQHNQENQEGFGVAQNFFPLGNYQSPFPAPLLNNSCFNWDPNSNLSLSHFGTGGHSFAIQTEESHSNNSAPPSMAFPSSSQLYFYPSAATLSSVNFPPLIPPFMTTSVENDSRQMNHLQPFQQQNSLTMPTLQLISSPMKHIPTQKTVQSPENGNKERRNS